MTHGRFISMVGFVAAVILAVSAMMWIHLPIQFERPCRLLPASEWILLNSQPDTFEAHLIDRRLGNHRQINLFRFERGDLVHFTLANGISPGKSVQAGQTVAQLDSHLNRTTFKQLGPQLQQAEANLRAAQTGERNEIIAQARSEELAALATSRRWEKEFARAEQQSAEGLISASVYDETCGLHEEAQAELQVARNGVLAAESGEKEAIVAAWQAEVDLLRCQLEDAQLRLTAAEIRCPIAGEVVTSQEDSVLIRIADIDTLYAIAPVSPSRAVKLSAGQGATIRPMGISGDPLEGEIIHVDRHASVELGLTFFWVTIAVPNPELAAVAGLRGDVQFRGDEVTLLAWLVDRITHASDRALGA